MNTITPSSLVTLHYSVTTPEGQTLISTFEATPATLKMGSGEVMPSLERCLLGLKTGESRSFDLPPGEGFGQPKPALIERFPLAALPNAELSPRCTVQMTFDNGQKIVGLVLELNEETALIDFNHPLAGKAVRFEVQVIGVN